MTQDHNNSSGADDAADKEIHDSMRLAGWVLPKSPQEIDLAEQALADQPVKLPDKLVDPYALLARPSGRIRLGVNLPTPQDLSAEQNLAQAAREGGVIPPDVQEQMKQDRRTAKGDKDE